jgi:multiple sugar transport system permease protein
MRKRLVSNGTRWLGYAMVAFGAFIMLMPFYFMFVFATHSNTDILSVPPPMWFGDQLIQNVKQLLGFRPHFWRSVAWSLWIATAITVLNLLFCSLAGYAFAMFEFRYRETLFASVLATMLFIPGACGALGIFMMRQYISSAVPRELIDAARMDGCGEFGIYWRIVLPLISPALGTLALITFIGSYNNFVGALLVLRDQDSYTLPLVLRSLQGTSGITWGALSVGAAIAVLPLLVLFAIYSRRLIDGLTAGSVKG